jgi:hypothetical protein
VIFPPLPSISRLRACALALIVMATAGGPLAAAEDETEVWLVTYGPGEIYWQRFGHNAIWIRNQGLGIDHTFNFGFFDFAQENFLWRFLQGRMLYFSAAQPSREEFAAYINENRSIRAQRLALAPERADALASYLLTEVRPENRDYLYDYYLNNCSTRVRDALDEALSGALSAAHGDRPAGQSWRDHTRRLTASDFWLYLGLESVLGSPVDRPISQWDEMFIPAALATAIGDLQSVRDGRSQPLVEEDVMLYVSTLQSPAATPRGWWPRYLLASLGLLALAWLVTRVAGRGLAAPLARAWLGLAGLAGLALVFFWFGTDHAAAGANLNILIFNPLWLAPALWRGYARGTLPLVAACSVAALLAPLLPPGQYNLDVAAAFLPLNLAAAAVLRSRSR